MQKKSLTITVVALAAMSAVWLGGTWYTGSKIEEQYLKQIDDINQQGWIKIDDVQLERHFFSVIFNINLILMNIVIRFKLKFITAHCRLIN